MADTNLWKPEVRVGGQQEGVLPLGSQEVGMRAEVQPIGSSRKNLVFMV